MATVPGVYPLVLVNFGDLVDTSIDGVYRASTNTDLVATATPGVYTLAK